MTVTLTNDVERFGPVIECVTMSSRSPFATRRETGRLRRGKILRSALAITTYDPRSTRRGVCHIAAP